jgi:ATP-binding cassette, subfamily G (WHITE), member 2, PDR
MSIVNGTGFMNYDRTAQAAGAPPLTSPVHESLGEDDANPLEKTASHKSTLRNRQPAADTDKGITPDSGTTQEGDDSELERRESIVHSLARRYTTQSNAGAQGGNPFEADENSPLNPASKNFSARAWAKAIVDMDTAGFRSAGICFQNVNVHGFGQATDYQKDVANVWLDAAGLVRKIFGLSKPRKIDILRNFDGLVRKGEMLVVLGPPGSGCSTFLKTIAGETNGIYVDSKSYFNYQGTCAHGARGTGFTLVVVGPCVPEPLASSSSSPSLPL